MLKISKSIYIGLGQAGIHAVNHTMRQYEQSFEAGTIPPQIAFIEALSPDTTSVECLTHAFRTAMIQVSTPLAVVTDYEVTESTLVDVHVACLLSEEGVTEWMLELVAQIKEIFGSHISLYGYGMMTSDSKIDQQTAYRSLLILDNDHSDVEAKFNAFFLVEDKTTGIYPILDKATICMSVGLAMYLHGSLMSSSFTRNMQNADWKCGMYNVGDKMGWLHGLGICQLVYDKERAVKVYSMQVCEALLGMFLDEEDARQNPKPVPVTVDLASLLDEISVISSARTLRFSTDKPQGVRDQVAKYLDLWDTLTNSTCIGAASSRFRFKLTDAVEDILRTVGGVPKAMRFLEDVLSLCENLKQEIAYETQGQSAVLEETQRRLNNCLSDYDAVASRIFRRRSTMEDLLYDVSSLAGRLLFIKASLYRCHAAARIMEDFVLDVNAHLDYIKTLLFSLKAKQHDCGAEIMKIMASASLGMINEYDISMYDCSRKPYIDEEHLLKYFDYEELMLVSMNGDDIQASMCRYAETLPRCTFYKNRCITDVIEEMDEDTYQKVKYELGQRTRPLLRVNSKGLLNSWGLPVTESVLGSLTVAVYAENEIKSRLLSDYYVPSCRMQEWIPSKHPRMKQRMIFCQVHMAYIPYCLEAFDGVASYETDPLRPQI